MERTFRVATTTIIILLLISAALHPVLLISDSETYRNWVMIQISLQVIGAVTLIGVRNYSFRALVFFIFLSIPFAFINWRFINNANDVLDLFLFPIFWIVYGLLVFGVREKFKTHNTINGEKCA